jgi:hypothetical protein
MTVIPTSGRLKQEDGELGASLCYVACSSPAWVAQWDPVSKTTKQNNRTEGYCDELNKNIYGGEILLNQICILVRL